MTMVFIAKLAGVKHVTFHSHNAGNAVYRNKITVVMSKAFKMLMPAFVDEFWACSSLAAQFSFPKSIVKNQNNQYELENFATPMSLRRKKVCNGRDLINQASWQIKSRFLCKNLSWNEKRWELWGKHLPKLKKRYDLAISYMNGPTNYYVIDKVTSILQVLNLAELGVGSAMVYSMYKPIAEDDKDTICALMRLYKIYYRVIGSAIAVVGLGVTPFIPCLVSGSIPENLNLHILYLLNLAATVFSYWLFAYKNSLLMAHQRTDVTSKVSIAVGTVQYCTQFLAIYIFKNYYFYLIMAILSQIANNIVTSNIVSRMYPDYLPKGKLSKKVTRSINGRIKDLFIAKLGGVVLNSADTIVISAFLGLTLLAVYQNYYFIISSICGIMETLLTSIRAGLGNSYVTESREKNYIDLKKITFMFYWLIGMCTCCFLGVFQPFMELWVGESFLLPFSVVVLLCVYFYLYETTRLLNVFKDAGGVWHEDRFRPLISALVNLSLNLAAVKYIGIYGIVLSTIVALGMIEVPWLLRNIFTVMYDSSLFNDYFKMFVSWIVATVFSCASITVLTYKVTLSGWGAFAFFVVVSVLIPNIVFLLLMHRKEEFKLSISMVNRITHNKLPIIKNL